MTVASFIEISNSDFVYSISNASMTKIAIGQTEGANQIFSRPLGWVAPDPPVRDPSRSGQYLSWVADFILGHNNKHFT